MTRSFSRKNLWEKLPSWAKSGIGSALSVVPPAYVLGRRFRQCLKFINQAQWWSAEEAQAHQLQQLRSICTLAYDRTKFYRRLFDEAGFDPRSLQHPRDLDRLPFIDKDTVRAHAEEMCAVPPGSRGVDYTSTGGSSGVPMGFYIGSDRSATEYAHLVAGWQRAGYRLDFPQAIFRGQVVAPDRQGLRHEYDPLLRRHYYSNFHTTDDDLRAYVEHLRTIGPCFLHGYPSAIATLTRFLHRSGLPPPANIRGLLAGSENVYPEDRAATERLFGVPYLSWYGHSEKLVLAVECEHSPDYHVWPTYGYCELVNEAGKVVSTPGERGEIVGTGFINRVMPFIRYRTGDEAIYIGDRCDACGRKHLLIRDVRGHRTQEMLVAADGGMICWTAVNMHDDTFDAVRQFQFRQDRPGMATLRIVPGVGFDVTAVERMRRNLERKLAGRLIFDVEVCDEIPLTKRGKCTYVDQRIAELVDPRLGTADSMRVENPGENPQSAIRNPQSGCATS